MCNGIFGWFLLVNTAQVVVLVEIYGWLLKIED